LLSEGGECLRLKSVLIVIVDLRVVVILLRMSARIAIDIIVISVRDQIRVADVLIAILKIEENMPVFKAKLNFRFEGLSY